MKLSNLICAALISATSCTASAAIYNYDFTWNGSSLTTNASAAGNNLQVGDTVNATFHAAGNDYWTASAGTYIWAPIGVSDCGTRNGDMSWNFSLNGSVVDSGSWLNLNDSCVHITQSSSTTAAISFDQLSWSYIFKSSTANTDLLGTIFYEGFGSLSPATYVKNDVPEPSSILLFGLGIAALGFSRKKAAN